jgi:hypothetical protein
MLEVPCPDVRVPPVTNHVYVAPLPAFGTLAVLSVEDGQTAVGAVIDADGLATV